MHVPKICIVIALGATVFTKPISSVVHERQDAAPDGFTLIGPPNESLLLNMRIRLTSSNLPGLEVAVYQRAYHGYGIHKEHLTTAQAQSFVAPTDETTTKVTMWLSSNDINFTTISSAGDWLQINVNVSTANHILDANFLSFRDDSTGKEVVRTLSYSVPAELQPHIQLIHPTIAFPIKMQNPSLKIKKASSATISNSITVAAKRTSPECSFSSTTPLCVASLYGIPLTTSALPQNASRLAVALFNMQFPQEIDLEGFLEELDRGIPSNTNFTLKTIDGGSDPQAVDDSGAFSDAIVEYAVGIATNVPVEVISIGNKTDDGVDGNLDLVLNLLAQPNPPQVVLIPTGFEESSIPVSLAQVLCNSYMHLSSLGVSVIVPSGDEGVSGTGSTDCNMFIPTFPSTCPFVTSVGATTGFSPEVAAPSSGGGFSNVFPTPAYQQSAVSQYLSFFGSNDTGKFNTTGRGYPDISAQGDNMAIIVGEEMSFLSTTAISASIFAGIIAQLNAINIGIGFPALGLLNPFIYANSPIVTDITIGDNPGCDTNGFSATAGWDPVTGVGTPIFSIMNADAETRGF